MSNVYFLATAILTTIPGFSPISPASTFAPLSFVIVMSMMREAYEDYV
jgi:phospholipid-transporting ATPase